ncbi:NAD(P)/FAD-dependent oxidoreductase [Cypionkella sp.]|uniref:NAD(P)/FAD-dependent oxidoreductase n=1 Tax=Cypionkella sp. TaxID=2811411 RepID=UPI002AB92E10|nr:FAD-dependent oxidoreductase [Cypionkella sp.]MDZ4395833.1 FAD-dependent oxidoreductase [Cypionkella sp.]
MARVDLTVRGAGIFGLSVAWEAARRGARVRVIEAVSVGAGSSGGVVGALSPHVPESWNAKKAFQLDSLLMAAGWWGAVEAASGMVSGYGRVGRLQPLADQAAVELARARGLSAVGLWRGEAVWRVVTATGAGWEPASPSGWLVEDTLSARLHPRMGCAALVAAIEAAGGEVVVGEAEEVGPVVWATGVAGLASLGADLGRVVGGGVKGQAILLRYPAEGLPQLFAAGLHVVPHVDGTVAVGSTSEAVWDDLGVDHQVEELHARAVAALPVLAGAEVVERWAGVRPRAKTRAPLLGAWPGRAGHFVANGGFKIGFGMAPKVAEVVVDLVLEGRDAIPEGFRI